MRDFGEEYNEFLRGTSVRYEMYAEGLKTKNKSDINNYRSTSYFSANDEINVGFFGMATCEFETEYDIFSKGELITVNVVTPDFYESNFSIIDSIGEDDGLNTEYIYRGIFNKSIVYDAYQIAKEKADKLGVIPFFSYGFNMAISGGRYFDLYCVESDIIGNFYWIEQNKVKHLYAQWDGMAGSKLTRINIQTVDGETFINIYEEKLASYQMAYHTGMVTESINTGQFVGIFSEFTYKDNEYGRFKEGGKEFRTFTGYVKTTENQGGIYKITCNDTSEVFDSYCTADESSKLGTQPRTYNYVLDILTSTADVSSWGANMNQFPELFDDTMRTVYISSMTKREIIASIAAQVGANVYMDANGTMMFKWYGQHYMSHGYDDPYEIPEDVIYEDGLKVDTITDLFSFNFINYINVFYSKEEPPTITLVAGRRESDQTWVTTSNIYFKTMIYGFNDEYVLNVHEKIQLTYGDNGQAEMVGNFAYEVGDAIIINAEDTTYRFLISKIEHECDGGLITRIYSYVKPIETNMSTDANPSYIGNSQVVEVSQDVLALQTELTELKSKAIQNVLLNERELKNGATAIIPIASSLEDGAITKEFYVRLAEMLNWYEAGGGGGGGGTNIYGNSVTPVYADVLLTEPIVGEVIGVD